MILNEKLSKIPLKIIILLVLGFLIWDLGNPDALRQGTEGFYFSITKEMFQQKSFLTPVLEDGPHWSKPPLQFWLAYIFYLIPSGPSLLLARLSIFFVSMIGLLHISRWLGRKTEQDYKLPLLYFLGTVGILKYSRIFMLEIPLAITTFCSVLLFYDYLETRKHSTFAFASIVLGLSILVKGPISIVMASGSIFLYLCLSRKSLFKIPWKSFISWNVLALIVGGSWFLYSYLQFGDEFIQRFFLRENLGKFSAKQYPASVLFQGLFIFSFPWCLLLFSPLKKIFKEKLSFPTRPENQFLLITLLVFFSIWLIPAQKSHHYAFPAVFPFLTLLYLNIFKTQKDYPKAFIPIQRLLSFLPLLITFILVVCLFVDIPHLGNLNIFKLVFFIITLLILSWLFWTARELKTLFLSSALTLCLFWNFIAPSFFLPRLPDQVAKVIGKREVVTYYRKRSFFEEVLQREVTHKNPDEITHYLEQQNQDSVAIVKTSFYKESLQGSYQILASWFTWKKRTTFKQIVNALVKGSIESLQEQNYLVQKDPSKG